MDLVALQIFKTVAEAGGITRAAARLHRVQSNVTTRVRQLEADVGAQLFLRDRRRLALTAEGQVLLAYAERMLSLAEEAQSALRRTQPAGRLRIGTMESTAATRLPEVLSRYHAAYPDVRVELVTGTSGALLTRLSAGEVDAVFVADPICGNGFEQQGAFDEQLVLIAPRTLALSRLPRDLADHTVISFGAGCAYRKRLEDWLARAGVTPARVMEFQSYHAIVACVAAGSGVAIVPKSILDAVPGRDQLALHALPARLARACTMLVWRKGQRSAALGALSDQICG